MQRCRVWTKKPNSRDQKKVSWIILVCVLRHTSVPLSFPDVHVIGEAVFRKRVAYLSKAKKRWTSKELWVKHHPECPGERLCGQHHSKARSRYLRARYCEGRWKTRSIKAAKRNTKAIGRRATEQSWREWNTAWTGVKALKWTLRSWRITCVGQRS